MAIYYSVDPITDLNSINHHLVIVASPSLRLNQLLMPCAENYMPVVHKRFRSAKTKTLMFSASFFFFSESVFVCLCPSMTVYVLDQLDEFK